MTTWLYAVIKQLSLETSRNKNLTPVLIFELDALILCKHGPPEKRKLFGGKYRRLDITPSGTVSVIKCYFRAVEFHHNLKIQS